MMDKDKVKKRIVSASLSHSLLNWDAWVNTTLSDNELREFIDLIMLYFFCWCARLSILGVDILPFDT